MICLPRVNVFFEHGNSRHRQPSPARVAVAAVPGRSEEGVLGAGGLAFEVEEVALAVEAAAVAGEVAGGADDAVAGDDDADRVPAVGEAYGTGRGRLAQFGRELAVGGGLPVRNLLEQCPDPLLERCPVEGERHVELGQFTGEVCGELFGDGREGLALEVARGPEGRVVRAVTLDLHVEAGQGAVPGHQGQWAYGTVHDDMRRVHESDPLSVEMSCQGAGSRLMGWSLVAHRYWTA